MYKLLVTISFFISSVASAQTGLLMQRYYISGSLSVGQSSRAFADSSAWLQLGNDTTNRGLLLPKVLLDSINTTARALYVYDLQDSVLYHFDGDKRVRYMTYRDTGLVKQLILANAPDLSPFALKADTGRNKYLATYYYADSLAAQKVRYSDSAAFLPTKTFLAANYFAKGGNSYGSDVSIGTKDNFSLNVIAGNTSRLKIFPNGNVSIASTADNGYKLDVTGRARITDHTYIEKDLVFQNNTQGIQILDGNTVGATTSVLIGRNNGATGGRSVKIGNDNSSNPVKIWQYAIGQGNNLSAAGSSAIAIGSFNVILTEDTDQFIIGSANTFNYVAGATSRGQCIIGTNNSVLHKYSSIFGNYQQTTGDNQLIFADGNTNASTGGYRQVYFGSGPRSSLNGGQGAPVTINASGGNGTDKAGGFLRLAAGKSTGAAIPPDIVLATATATAPGSDLQALTDRWFVKGGTGYLSNSSSPASLVDLNGSTGYNQLRLRTGYTPSSSADGNGSQGDIAWDDNYIYVRTSAGWKRAALSGF
ncbi:MAG: hypothetical protein K8F30_00430 [Taibaiella sp.]|nr:hypothetical protein [Taibaiella sp.]